MNLKRVLTFAIVGGALAALIAGATTTGSRRATLPPVRSKRADKTDLSGAALAIEIDRLHERLRPTTPPEEPARNLFEFRSHAARTAAENAPTIVSATSGLSPVTPPPFELIGVATDGSGDATVRTAMLSGLGQLYLVKAGEAVNDRYRVVRVSADAVELSDTEQSAPVRIPLK